MKRPIWLMGEVGSGCLRLARLMHENSPAAQRSFVHLSCAEAETMLGLPEAIQLCRAVEGGTLYLEEIECLSPWGQGILGEMLKAVMQKPERRPWFIISSRCDLRRSRADWGWLKQMLGAEPEPIHLPAVRWQWNEMTFSLNAVLAN